MMRSSLVIALAALLLLGACSSQIKVAEIKNNLPAGTEVEGIPFRVPKRFIALIYEKQNDGYKQVFEQSVTLPDPDHLYLLGFESQLFSNATVELSLNSDNTIQQIDLKSASRGASALEEAGAQLSATATALQSRATAEETAATTKANLAVAADKAKQAADLAILENKLLQANPNASAEDLLRALNKERSAKLDANEAARRANKPPYFPDVVP
jgi:hypothetical protein